jgi:hypothetical protein
MEETMKTKLDLFVAGKNTLKTVLLIVGLFLPVLLTVIGVELFGRIGLHCCPS